MPRSLVIASRARYTGARLLAGTNASQMWKDAPRSRALRHASLTGQSPASSDDNSSRFTQRRYSHPYSQARPLTTRLPDNDGRADRERSRPISHPRSPSNPKAAGSNPAGRTFPTAGERLGVARPGRLPRNPYSLYGQVSRTGASRPRPRRPARSHAGRGCRRSSSARSSGARAPSARSEARHRRRAGTSRSRPQGMQMRCATAR